MDKITDNTITSHQGSCDLLSSKVYYLQECSVQDKADLVDQHRFRIFKDAVDGYSIESLINENKTMTATPNMTVTSVCMNNNSEVETVGNVQNLHVVSQGENTSFDYTFKRYYSKDNRKYGCQYESSLKLSFMDMFGVSENQGEITVFSKNAANVDISLSELNVEWYVNHIKIDSLDDQLSAIFDNDTLIRYTVSDEAMVYLIVDGVRFDVDARYTIDRRDYRITSVTQSDRIEGFDIKKDIYVDHNFGSITESVLFIDDTQIAKIDDYDASLVGKTVLAVMYRTGEPVPVAPFVVGENGVVNIKEAIYLEETVSAPYLSDGYFDLSSIDGSIHGLDKSTELPVARITQGHQIQNYTESKTRFFGTSKQLLFNNRIAPVADGNISVQNELGSHEVYRMEDIIATELVFEDREEAYVFSSRSSFEDNTDWTINNIDNMTFEIDSGRVYGDNVDMTYDAGINEVKKVSLTILWTTSLSGSHIQIYGIKADKTETLHVEVRNLTSMMSSIFNSRGTKVLEFSSYRYVEFIELEGGTKKIRIKINNSNIKFESLKLTLKRA